VLGQPQANAFEIVLGVCEMPCALFLTVTFHLV
jgi:hypothetical protein